MRVWVGLAAPVEIARGSDLDPAVRESSLRASPLLPGRWHPVVSTYRAPEQPFNKESKGSPECPKIGANV